MFVCEPTLSLPGKIWLYVYCISYILLLAVLLDLFIVGNIFCFFARSAFTYLPHSRNCLKECLVQLSMNYYRKQNTERKGMFLNVCKKIHVQNNFYFAATSPIKVVSFSHFILFRKTDNFFISSTKIFGNFEGKFFYWNIKEDGHDRIS